MPFCTKCGQQNSDTTKFCIKCGNTMLKAVLPVPVSAPENPVVLPNKEPAAKPIMNNAMPAKKNNWLVPTIIVAGLAVIAVACYFLFFKESNNDNHKTDMPNADLNKINSYDSPKVARREEVITTGGALIQRINSTENLISDEEIKTISSNINALYNAENRKEYTTALGFFSYPITRYYNFSNLSYQQMADVYNQSDTKLPYHENFINITSSMAEKTNYGYRLVIHGEYKFTTVSVPDSVKVHNINAELLLNTNYKIFMVRDNK